MTIRERVEVRASYRCEYCHSPQVICAYTFHVEHIAPRSQGGADNFGNYALACFFCNLSKLAFTTGIDPKTNLVAPLFNPRSDQWDHHFAWNRTHTEIKGLTDKGRATLLRLNLNRVERRKARKLWLKTEVWP